MSPNIWQWCSLSFSYCYFLDRSMVYDALCIFAVHQFDSSETVVKYQYLKHSVKRVAGFYLDPRSKTE
jgi:hypothetical protein